MQTDLSKWTVVLAGQWNRALLSTEWIAENLIDEVDIQIQIVLDNGEAIIKYITEHFDITPTSKSLIFASLTETDESVQRTIDAARRTAEILSHTPIKGVGVNFGYTETDPSEGLLDLFNFERQDDLIAVYPGEIVAREFSTKILREDGRILVVRVILDQATQVHWHFNFHADVTPERSAVNLLGEDCYGFKAISEQIVDQVYIQAGVM